MFVQFVSSVKGVFIASADDSLVIAIYGAISSEFGNLSDGPFLMTGYTLGYSVALPVVGYLASTACMVLSMSIILGNREYNMTSASLSDTDGS